MPELPEVEIIRRQLDPVLRGRRLASVEVLDPRWSAPLPAAEMAAALCGREVHGLCRRGKYLLWRLSGDAWLVQHLRMTGALLLEPREQPGHVRVRIELEPARAGAADGANGGEAGRESAGAAGERLFICDPRRFGTGVLLFGDRALQEHLAARLGVEPFAPEFDGAYLHARLRGRRTSVKALLLDQRIVAGVGNIYADEALFAARIHPARSGQSVSGAQCARLCAAVRAALAAGIDARGATIGDFRHIDGVRGSFQDRFQVHRRAGEPCPRCGRRIEKIRVAGRGTYFCPGCQRAPRRRTSG